MTSKFFVLVGGMASGKTTLLNELQRFLPNVRVVVAFTTREKRKNEIAGFDYRFISNEDMLILQKRNAIDCLRSYTLANGQEVYYGLPSMETYSNKTKVLITDVKGLKELKAKYGEAACGIFISRSREDRFKSLISRGDDIKEIQRRLKADEEDYGTAGLHCDYTIHNDFTESAVITLKEVIIKEANIY